MIELSTDHPRPFLQRPWTTLDGDWDFALDPDQQFRRPEEVHFDHTIRVPFAPETPASGIGPEVLDGDFVRCCWYRRRLGVEAPADGRTILLHFGAVDRIADVWVDGHHVAHHVGGYTAFSADIGAYAHADAEVVVRAIDDPHDLGVPRGKQDWRPTPHAIWYPPTTGIWRTVWVEEVPSTRLAHLEWRADVSSMSLTMQARVEGPLPDALEMHVGLEAGGRLLVDDRIRVLDRTVVRKFPLGDGGFDDRFSLVWFPARPTLIDARLTLMTGGADLDEAVSYTALRSVDVSDGQIRINGRPYPLRLVLDQGYWPETGATAPDAAALRRDIELTKQLGFNGVRKHQKVEDPRYFALADRLGLLCWVEMPSPYRPGPRTAETLVREWTEVVRSHVNHPSVIAWVPVNESWGVPACEHEHEQRALIEALADVARSIDGSRPISSNDGWETIGGEIVGVHDYDQEPAVLRSRWGSPETIDTILTGRRADGKLADLDRTPAGGRAVVLSEFGGIALSTDVDGSAAAFGTANWGYDDARSADDLLERYRAQWAAVHESSGLAGACWTQLTDTYQEVNGLLRADRTPKVDPERIADATKGRARGAPGDAS